MVNVETERRNFPGLKKKQWYNLAELKNPQLPNTTKTSGHAKES